MKKRFYLLVVLLGCFGLFITQDVKADEFNQDLTSSEQVDNAKDTNVIEEQSDTNEDTIVNHEKKKTVKKEAILKTKTSTRGEVIGDELNKFYIDEFGKVMVQGDNTYGQLGLGYAYTTTITEFQKLSFIKETVQSISYDDKTLTVTIDDNNSYQTGKNVTSFKVPAYYITYSDVTYESKSNIFKRYQKMGQTNRVTTFTDKDLNKRSNVIDIKANQYSAYYYNTKGYLIRKIDANYSNGIAYRIFNNYYNSVGKWSSSHELYSSNKKATRILNYKNIYNKKKVIRDQRFSNNKLYLQINYAYNKKATFVTKKTTNRYASNKARTSLLIENNRSAKVRSYKWYATYDHISKRQKGVTRTWYNKRNKVTKIDARISGITYYSQKNRNWKNTMCRKAPYGGIIQENGCMLSSFAMINSKYGKKKNPKQLRQEGLDCNLDYKLAARKYGYKVQNTYPTRKYSRNVNSKFYNSSRLVKNNKSTYTLKDALTRHQPVQLWLTPNKRLHRGHSVVAYAYVYKNGRWDVKIYDPYTPRTPRRSLKDVSKRHYIAKAQVWEKTY
ncbi:MAG: C39 family peptidase [Erysipelotrichales bacterium]